MADLLLHNGFQLETKGRDFLIEFHDGEQRWMYNKDWYMIPKRVNIKPHRRCKEDPEGQEEMRKAWLRGEYPKWAMLDAIYEDELGETWLGMFIPDPVTGEHEDILLNAKYWGYY